jgi:hypothetical protein
LGTFTGSSGAGTIIINIDELESHYQGVAYTHQNDRALPSTAAFFTTPN